MFLTREKPNVKSVPLPSLSSGKSLDNQPPLEIPELKDYLLIPGYNPRNTQWPIPAARILEILGLEVNKSPQESDLKEIYKIISANDGSIFGWGGASSLESSKGESFENFDHFMDLAAHFLRELKIAKGKGKEGELVQTKLLTELAEKKPKVILAHSTGAVVAFYALAKLLENDLAKAEEIMSSLKAVAIVRGNLDCHFFDRQGAELIQLFQENNVKIINFYEPYDLVLTVLSKLANSHLMESFLKLHGKFPGSEAYMNLCGLEPVSWANFNYRLKGGHVSLVHEAGTIKEIYTTVEKVCAGF